jgi:hypothetical protein
MMRRLQVVIVTRGAKAATLCMVLVIAASAVAFATHYCRRAERHNMVTQEQALVIARQEMERHGRRAEDYTESLDTETGPGDSWLVWFEAKGPYQTPGGKHGVRINKQTGKAEYLPGE